MARGTNIFNNSQRNSYNYSSFQNRSNPVVFLSHKSEDKDYVEQIGEYIMSAGIDIYLDKYDPALQRADSVGDDKKVTECIQEGISRSTHILCIISEKTKNSWWVPYEIGYGKKSDKELASLIRKDVTNIPSYLSIEKTITNIDGINDYIKEILRNSSSVQNYSSNLYNNLETASYYHKLSKYLKVY